MEENNQSVTMRLPLATNRPWTTWILLSLNVLIYIATIGMSMVILTLNHQPITNVFSPISGVLRLAGWKENALIDQGQYWRLLTAMFLHGGLMHLIFNSFALYSLGTEGERIYGSGRFLSVYVLSGLAGGIVSYAFSPHPSVGASGAIFGIIGALAVFFYTTREILGDIGRRQLQSMMAIIVINGIIGLSAGGVIDNYAHMGGLVGGLISGWIVVPRYHLDRRFWPPVIERRLLPLSWVGVGAMVLFLGMSVVLIRQLL